jgi:hypothetical protein
VHKREQHSCLIDTFLKCLRLIATTFKEFSNSLDNVNTAWHEGKALDNFQVVVRESGEISDGTDVNVASSMDDIPSDHLNVVIVTESVPSRATLFNIKRSMNNINRRFHTQLTAQIIQLPRKMRMQRMA